MLYSQLMRQVTREEGNKAEARKTLLGQRTDQSTRALLYSLLPRLSGTAKDGTEAKGTMTWPEVSHEIEDDGDEYRVSSSHIPYHHLVLCSRLCISAFTNLLCLAQFETTMTSANSASTTPLYQIVRTRLAPSLLPHFHSFRSTLIETHAADLGHASPSGGSGTSTPKPSSTTTSVPSTTVSASKPTPAGSTSAASSSTAKKGVSTATKDVVLEARLAIEAKDLFDLLTNPAKIPMWSRAPAEVSRTMSNAGQEDLP